MELGSVLIVILMFFLSGLFVLRPFLVKTDRGGRAGTTVRDTLVAEKERLLQAIEEIDLEFELKKISSEEHTGRRARLMSEAARVLKELDQLPKSSSEKKKKGASAQNEDALEKMIAERRKELQENVTVNCPHCGQAVEKGTQFCSHCGGAL